MCRPSCCKPRSQAPGIAAVAVIIGAGIAVHKISHILARIAHDIINALLLIALTAGAIAAAAITIWMVTWVVRWWLRHRTAHFRQGHPIQHIRTLHLRPVRERQPCLACGGNGQVLRADTAGRFEPRACPECQPARLAG